MNQRKKASGRFILPIEVPYFNLYQMAKLAIECAFLELSRSIWILSISIDQSLKLPPVSASSIIQSLTHFDI
jgi:hypothetical protein